MKYEACKGCKNWLDVKIKMDGYEGDDDIIINGCGYGIPGIILETETNFMDIKKCSMKESK